MNPMWERLGQEVALRRKAQGWTQDEVTARGGPSDSLQSEIEAGRWKTKRSVRGSLKKIDDGMRWRDGSAAAVLSGGDPVPLEDLEESDDELLSRLRHPAYSASLEGEPHEELTHILTQVISQGLNDALRGSITRFLEDQNIESFPKIFAALTRDRKLKVYKFGSQLHAEQLNGTEDLAGYLSQQKEQQSDVEATTQSVASTEADETQEALADDTQVGDATSRIKAVVKRVAVKKPQHGGYEGA